MNPRAKDTVQDWLSAGVRVTLLMSAVIAINPHIDGFRLFMAVTALIVAIRLVSIDERGA